MKLNKMLFVFGLSALALSPTNSMRNFNEFRLQKANEVHAHVFDNNRCTCGTVKIEAEDGTVKGTPTYNNPTFIETNELDSGTGHIGNRGNGDNIATWNLNVNKEMSNVPLSFQVVPIGSSVGANPNSALLIRLNGETINIEGEMPPFYPDQWYNYQDLFVGNIALKEGNNNLEIEAYEGYSFNFDYFTLGVTNDIDVTIGEIEAGHIHEFTGERCECGTYKIEAENVSSIQGRPTDPEGQLIVENSTCSGGGHIGNWGNGDNIATWEINVSEEISNVDLSFYLVAIPPSDTRSMDNTLLIRVNGATISAASATPTFGGDYHDYKEVQYNKIQLKKGKNKIEMEAYEGNPFNIDYFTLGVPKEITIQKWEEGMPEEHKHTFEDGRCVECHAINIEAENGTVEGINTDSSGTEDFIFSATSTNDRPTSGGMCVGNFASPGNTITWDIESNRDVENIGVELWISPCGSSGPVNDFISLTNNGEALEFSSDYFPGFPGGDAWYNWTKLDLINVNLVKGNNSIVLTNLNGNAFNTDNLVFLVDETVELSVKEIDRTPPDVGVITIDSDELIAGKEINFSYEATDNVTTSENLTFDVKVYLNYGVPGQSIVESTSNSFTPTEPGEYTILVTARDEAGNESTSIRKITIDG